MDLEDKEACLEQVRLDFQTIRASTEEISRTAGVILATAGVLLVLYLELIFSKLSTRTFSIEIRIGDLASIFSPGDTGIQNLHEFQFFFMSTIILFGISGFLCLIAFLENIDTVHRPKMLLEWRCLRPDRKLQVHTITALLYLETYYLEGLILRRQKIGYVYSAGVYAFFFALASAVLSAYAIVNNGITSWLGIVIVCIIYAYFIGYILGKLAKSSPRFNESLKGGEKQLKKLEKKLKDEHIL